MGELGVPRLEWGSRQRSSGHTHQPPTSQERLGGHQGERQLSHWAFLLLCQAVPSALLSLSLQRYSALLQRGCLSPITGASIILPAPSLPPGSLVLPQRKASITGCPGVMQGWAGGGSPGRVETEAGTARGWVAFVSRAGAHCPSVQFFVKWVFRPHNNPRPGAWFYRSR